MQQQKTQKPIWVKYYTLWKYYRVYILENSTSNRRENKQIKCPLVNFISLIHKASNFFKYPTGAHFKA